MNVEDRAFGVMDEEEDAAGPPVVRTLQDSVAVFMLPLTTTIALLAVVCYSLLKAMEYRFRVLWFHSAR